MSDEPESAPRNFVLKDVKCAIFHTQEKPGPHTERGLGLQTKRGPSYDHVTQNKTAIQEKSEKPSPVVKRIRFEQQNHKVRFWFWLTFPSLAMRGEDRATDSAVGCHGSQFPPTQEGRKLLEMKERHHCLLHSCNCPYLVWMFPGVIVFTLCITGIYIRPIVCSLYLLCM